MQIIHGICFMFRAVHVFGLKKTRLYRKNVCTGVSIWDLLWKVTTQDGSHTKKFQMASFKQSNRIKTRRLSGHSSLGINGHNYSRSSACSKSSQTSSHSSSPTDNRISWSVIPISCLDASGTTEWVIVAGC